MKNYLFVLGLLISLKTYSQENPCLAFVDDHILNLDPLSTEVAEDKKDLQNLQSILKEIEARGYQVEKIGATEQDAFDINSEATESDPDRKSIAFVNEANSNLFKSKYGITSLQALTAGAIVITGRSYQHNSDTGSVVTTDKWLGDWKIALLQEKQIEQSSSEETDVDMADLAEVPMSTTTQTGYYATDPFCEINPIEIFSNIISGDDCSRKIGSHTNATYASNAATVILNYFPNCQKH